jgi:hypothetical protein
LLRGEQRKAWLRPGSAIAGLPLFALGFDHQRWIANLVLGQWLLQLAYAQAAGKWSLLAEVVARHRIWLVLAVLASLALGPLGVTSTMEWRFALLRPR